MAEKRARPTETTETKVLTCVWCGGTGEDPLFDVPDPDRCVICEGKGGYRIVREGDRYLGYEPMDPTQLEVL